MTAEREQLEATIAELEGRRHVLGDPVVDSALAPLRARLASLTGRPADETSRQALKLVSILFLDVVRSTELSQSLDPEQISDLFDGALERFSLVLEEHGGKVLKFAGDSILAVFGADQAREDDAERAVHAGLALLAEASEQAQRVERLHHFEGFDVRVGVHTGDVLLGAGVDAASGVRGQSVNVAARMEQSAPPGTLRISHATYTHVRGVFEVAAQDPLSVKGVDDPIRSYLVFRARPHGLRRRRRGIEGVASRMIGRDAELTELQQRFARLSSHPALTFVTVVADAGVGKSRLLEEFEAWGRGRPGGFEVLRGHATPQTQVQPFALLRDVLLTHFDIPDNAPLDATRKRWEQALVALFEDGDGAEAAEGHAHVLGHLIGIDYADSRHVRGAVEDAKRIWMRAFNVAARIFRRLAATHPEGFVVELEDLHWADSETLDFLEYAAEVLADVPALVLGTTRPELFERRTWASTDELHHRIDLTPLNAHFSRLLVDELLQKLENASEALRQVLLTGSEGNPFYMEELVNMFIDYGAIRPVSDGWEVDEDRLLARQVPATLTGVLQARLDSLPVDEKLTLQEASVIGSMFWDDALSALDGRALAALPRLVERQLTLPQAAAAIDGANAYAFKHHMLHQVTYKTLLKRTKRELHGALGRWFAGQQGQRASDFLSIAAGHFESAGELAEAAEFRVRAAEQAMTRFAHHAVLDHVQHAVALLDQQPDTDDTRALRWRLLDAQFWTLGYQGMRSEQRSALDTMQALADALDDDVRRAQAAWRRCVFAQETADWPESERAARLAMALAERAGADELRLRAMRQLGTVLALQGQPETGKAVVESCLTQAVAIGLRKVEGVCLNSLAIIAHRLGDPILALELNERALALARELGDRGTEPIALANVGAARCELGDFENAERDLQAGLRLIRTQGDRLAEAGILCSVTYVAAARRDYPRARTLARATIDLSASVEARDWEAYALAYLGQAEVGLGRHDAARAAFEQSLAKAPSSHHPAHHEANARLAAMVLSEGDVASARALIEPLLQAPHDSPYADLICFEVLDATGDARAAALLERAHTAVQATAASISDAALRAGYLRNIPENGEILEAWRSRHAGRDALVDG
jgi:class 3 adenylate cyclase/predicted ATPase